VAAGIHVNNLGVYHIGTPFGESKSRNDDGNQNEFE
jgi:hypothetical protein